MPNKTNSNQLQEICIGWLTAISRKRKLDISIWGTDVECYESVLMQQWAINWFNWPFKTFDLAWTFEHECLLQSPVISPGSGISVCWHFMRKTFMRVGTSINSLITLILSFKPCHKISYIRCGIDQFYFCRGDEYDVSSQISFLHLDKERRKTAWR